MTDLAIALVLGSAFIHATWNLVMKRAGGGVPLQWLFTAVSIVGYGPLALVLLVIQHPDLGGVRMLFVLGSGIFHAAYFILLSNGYRAGDLSLVYPLARGIGPMLATAGAIILLGEHPTGLAMAGTVLIVAGAFFLAGNPRALRATGSGRAVAFAGLTGAVIAAYTLWDKEAVGPLAIPPIFYFWSAVCIELAIVSPPALRRWPEVVAVWRDHRTAVVLIGALSPLSYIMVLTALAISPVSYVAPMREVGVLIGAVMGLRLLSEGQARRRLTAAGVMLAGVVALALR
jgi:uncharacterized membrane protein